MRRGFVTTLVLGVAFSLVASPVAAEEHGSPACPDGAPSAGFDDVAEGNVHATSIDCAAELGLLQGVDADTFAPGRDVTRGQAATLLTGVLTHLGLPLPSLSGAPQFDDAGAAHGDNVRRLAAAGIVSGHGDGTFAPHDPVSREQLASLLVATYGYVLGDAVTPESRGHFDDAADGVHAANVDAAYELGLVRGTSAETFEPASSTRRDQAASLVTALTGVSLGQVVGEVWSLDQGTDLIHVHVEEEGYAEIVEIDVSPQALADAGFDAAPDGDNTVPHMIEFDSQERYAFVAATAGAVTIVIDARSKEVVEVVDTGPATHMAAVTPDDSAVWVAVMAGERLVEIPLNLDTAEPVFEIDREVDVRAGLASFEDAEGWEFSSYNPVCHQYSPDSAEAWVTLGPGWADGGLFVLDLASGEITDAFDPDEVKANCGVSVTEDHVVANWSGNITEGDDQTDGEWYVIDAHTKELSQTGSAEGVDAHGVRLTPDGSSYWLVNRGSDNAIVIDAETFEVVERYEDVAQTPDILDFNADASLVYISQRGPNPRSGAAHVATGPQPGVAVVDAATGETVTVIEPPELLDGDGAQLNDVHGVAVRLRGDGEVLAD